jgi:hypothetical protein
MMMTLKYPSRWAPVVIASIGWLRMRFEPEVVSRKVTGAISVREV